MEIGQFPFDSRKSYLLFFFSVPVPCYPSIFSSVYIRGKGGFISDMYLPQLFVFS